MKITFPLLILAFFASINLCSVSTLPAQEPNPLWALSDEITFGEGGQIQAVSTKGTFEPVPLDPFETADIKLQFPASLAGAPVSVEVLDGGQLTGIGESAVLDGDGAVSFQFNVFDQPGLYRILATAGAGSVGMVQFEVPNPPE
jgi:hypothetical protein